MESVLQKTVQSLEAALRYNPTSLELMTSLAEVYVRLGRFDQRTMELCATVLNQQVDNALVQQGQLVGMTIDQSRDIEEALQFDQPPPPEDALKSSLEMLDEFLLKTPDCLDGWMAWVRFQLLLGAWDRACEGLEKLRRLGKSEPLAGLENSLRHSTKSPRMRPDQGPYVARFYQALGGGQTAIQQLEKLYDDGVVVVGPTLLTEYLKRYTPTQPEAVPEALRDRLLRLLLDHSDHRTLDQWLRKATLLGWQVKTFSKSYAAHLMEDDQLLPAFAVLQHISLDAEVKEWLNRIASLLETRGDYDGAVEVLRYLNNNELLDVEVQERREQELACEAELTMAELQLRNGRVTEALLKYISAMRLSRGADASIIGKIDELLESSQTIGISALIELGRFFRTVDDHPKALYYTNEALRREPGSREVLEELESLFDEILDRNPDMPELRLELGSVYLQMDRLAEAVEELKLAAAAPALAARANRLLAKAFIKQGKTRDALDKLRAIKVETQDVETLYTLHEKLLDSDAPRDAMTALDLISRVNPEFRDVSDKLRILEERVGKAQPEAVVDSKMRELIGDLAVGRYQYLDRLGSGGMGVVYKIFDIRNQQTVAMKILRDGLSGNSKALDRFFREARIAATLRHRNIVNIFDYNISNINGQSFIVMEYVDGPSLREVVDRQFENTMCFTMEYLTEVLHYSVQLCEALEASHAKGIIHRDIKPDNVMINSRGDVKITDFGIVHIEEATFTPTGAMLGTPRYMSPEQVTGGKIDARSDIYSVGILLYEILAGSPPFVTGDVSYQQVHTPPISPREINPKIPQQAESMIMKCLSKEPDDRYMNCHSLKLDLKELLESLGGSPKFNNPNHTDVLTPLGTDSELDLD